jgi:alanyl-tRNA synthetase
MPSERLYYDDPLLLSFAAQVMARCTVAGRPALVLDRTAFYPTSGGQPHDRGTLNGVPVVEVIEEEGEVWHVLEAEVSGDAIQGQVDGVRRFDHMQQHTGQHILSQTFVQLLASETVSFHLGADYATIDLDRADLSAADLARVEDRANAIVFEDRPVLARFVTPDELAQMPLRKAPAGHERVRIVEVAGFDWSPCGGTHCTRTGQVGSIHVTHSERRGAETRVTFLCGWRALRDARWKHSLLNELATTLTVGFADLPGAVGRLSVSEHEARKALEHVCRQLLHYEAGELYQQAEAIGAARVVQGIYRDRSLEEVRTLAREIAALPGGVALLGLRGEDARLCFARAEGLPWDMGALVREAAGLLGGRGGGRPSDAQGGGPDVARLDEALARALESLRQ